LTRKKRKREESLPPQERAQTYETIINQKLILQAAKKAGVTVSASELDEAFLANISQQLNLPRVYSEKELNDLVMANKKMSFAEFVKDQTGMGVEEVKKPNHPPRPYLETLPFVSKTSRNCRRFPPLTKKSATTTS